MENPIKALKGLMKEKQKRNIPSKQPIFIAVADIAGMFWCNQKMIFKIKENELNIYSGYLNNIKKYGSNLSVKELDRILKSEELEMKRRISNIKNINEKVYSTKKWHIILDNKNAELSESDLEYLDSLATIDTAMDKIEKILKKRGIKSEFMAAENTESTLFDESIPLDRGFLDEGKYAERYPSVRYHFDWNDYVIMGIPDGITKDFCYEFKSTTNGFSAFYIKPIAIAQAQLYSYFFKRPKIRVQILTKDNGKIATIEEKADKKKAEEILRTMDGLLKEKKSAIPPKPWKCRSCGYINQCKLRKNIV